jgi:hypothetical protein
MEGCDLVKESTQGSLPGSLTPVNNGTNHKHGELNATVTNLPMADFIYDAQTSKRSQYGQSKIVRGIG